MTTRALRFTRGLALAVLATFAAAMSHVVAGGHIGSVFSVTVSLLISVPLGVFLAGRRIALWRTAAIAALAQLVYHWLFDLAGAAPSLTAGADLAGHAHQHQADLQALLSTATGAGLPASYDASAMTLSHALTAALTVWLLRRGEVALQALIRSVRVLAAKLLARVPQPAATGAPLRLAGVRAVSADTGAAQVWPSSLGRRGPPLGAETRHITLR